MVLDMWNNRQIFQQDNEIDHDISQNIKAV